VKRSLGIVLLVIVLCGTTQAWGRKPPKDTLLPPALRDSFPEAVSYAYSTARKCGDSALAARLYRAFEEHTGLTGKKWPDARYEVWIAAPHPFVESLLPGALLVTVHTQSWIRKDGGAGYTRHFVFFRGRYWGPRIANGLATEVGLSFDSSAALTRAKLGIVLAGFEDLSRTSRQWGEYSRHLSSDTAVPSLTFLKATRVKSFQGRPFNDGFSVEMLIGGKRTHVFVQMTTPDKWGRTYPSGLWGGGLNQNLDMPRMPEPKGPTGQGLLPNGGRPRDTPVWQLAPTGGLTPIHVDDQTYFFATADSNHSPGHDTGPRRARGGTLPIFLDTLGRRVSLIRCHG
jgi:hypothetical protein